MGPYEAPLGEPAAGDVPVLVIFLLVLHYQFIVSVVGFREVIGSREVIADDAESRMAWGMAIGGVRVGRITTLSFNSFFIVVATVGRVPTLRGGTCQRWSGAKVGERSGKSVWWCGWWRW